MRFGSMLVSGSACLLLFGALSACGGKVYEAGGDAGSAGSGGTGGSGGTAGSGGTLLGGSGGGPAGSGGYTAGSGGGPAGSGGYPAGSGGGPGGTGGYTGGSGGGIVGGSGGGPGGTGGYAGGSCWNILPPYTECRDCLDMNCCGEVMDCFADQTGSCPHILNCYENCPIGDPYECASMCDNGNFNYEFSNLFTCGESFCAGSCATPTPPPPNTCPLQTGIPQCDDCMHSKCGNECYSCVNNPQCMELLQCISYCQDEACQQQCLNNYPGGVDALLAFLGVGGCLDVNCSSECY